MRLQELHNFMGVPLYCFPPVSRGDARVLILGSMPGERSLREAQYYAYPHNAFWPIMAQLFDFSPTLPYAERLEHLKANHVALWDVLASCRRKGSLDSAIEADSVRPNDFGAFLLAHPQLRVIFFNGGPAEQLFRRHVLPRLAPLPADLPLLRLPSTSPANARLKLEEKLTHWRQLREFLAAGYGNA